MKNCLLLSALLLTISQSAFAQTSTEVPAKTVIWSYDDDYTGQEEWGLLTPAFAACGIGTQQSPISITRTVIEKEPPARMFHYKPGDVSVSNIGYTIEVKPQAELSYEEAGVHYSLKYIHFHSPSEHVMKGEFFPLEIQFFHEGKDGKRLIVAVFATIGKALPEMDGLLAAAPTRQGVHNELAFNIALLLPNSFAHYAYPGSLTTPPCTEGVDWRVMKNKITLSKEQLVVLSKFTQRNARLAQPVYMRTVKEVN